MPDGKKKRKKKTGQVKLGIQHKICAFIMCSVLGTMVIFTLMLIVRREIIKASADDVTLPSTQPEGSIIESSTAETSSSTVTLLSTQPEGSTSDTASIASADDVTLPSTQPEGSIIESSTAETSSSTVTLLSTQPEGSTSDTASIGASTLKNIPGWSCYAIEDERTGCIDRLGFHQTNIPGWLQSNFNGDGIAKRLGELDECHQSAKFYMCARMFPKCTATHALMSPCFSTCQDVTSTEDCRTILKQWDDEMDVDFPNQPESAKFTSCISMENNTAHCIKP